MRFLVETCICIFRNNLKGGGETISEEMADEDLGLGDFRRRRTTLNVVIDVKRVSRFDQNA